MDSESLRNDPSLGEAMAALAELEKSTTPEPTSQPESGSMTDAEAHAGDSEGEEVQSSEPDSKSGASATEDKAKPAEQGTKPVETGKDQSKFAKNQARLEGGWKQLNERKAEFEKQQAEIKRQQESLEQAKREFETTRQKSTQPKYKPEDYEQAAQNWEKEADSLEAEGRFEEADKKRVMVEQARERAKDLRANPPPAPKTDAQAEVEFRAAQKEWWSKAAIDFPSVVKDGSPEKEALTALVKSEPAVLNDPKGMYYAARLVCAETSAARVPAMEKELGDLRAKVQALNERMAIPGDGAAASVKGEMDFKNKSEAEQLADLYREAQAVDSRGW